MASTGRTKFGGSSASKPLARPLFRISGSKEKPCYSCFLSAQEYSSWFLLKEDQYQSKLPSVLSEALLKVLKISLMPRNQYETNSRTEKVSFTGILGSTTLTAREFPHSLLVKLVQNIFRVLCN